MSIGFLEEKAGIFLICVEYAVKNATALNPSVYY